MRQDSVRVEIAKSASLGADRRDLCDAILPAAHSSAVLIIGQARAA